MKKTFSLLLQISLILPLGLLPVAEVHADATVIFLTDTGATSWSVPSDWNNSNNTIEVIGAGARGANADFGGGGGAYSKSTNVTLTPGGSVGINVGAGSSGADGVDGEDTYLCNSTSNCASIGGTAVVVGAKGGSYTGPGGASASGVGDVKYSGGAGGASNDTSCPGGAGGAGGPNGVGGAGGVGLTYGGAGGGGGGGGSAGTSGPGDFNSGAGGNNYLGVGGGASVGFTSPGNHGVDGGGGGGIGYAGGTAGNGGAGTEWDATHGSGGGAGGTCQSSGTGGAGGLYGGGSSGGAYASSGNDSAQGIIVITYTPGAAATRVTLSKPANNLGLVGYWSMNEGSGTVAGDFSGNNNSGSLSGATWTNGKFGKAVSLDGVNDYVSGSGVNLAGTPFTISAWIRTNYTANETYFSLGTEQNSNKAIHLRLLSNTSVRFALFNDDVDVTLTDIANRWTHIVVTLDSSLMQRVYQDGVEVGSRQAGAYYSGDTTWNVGRFAAVAGEYVTGSIDDVRVYTRQLSNAEVRSLYTSGVATVGGAEKSKVINGLVGYWPFNGSDVGWTSATAGSLYDRSGRGNDGTLTNMTQATAPTTGKISQGLKFDGVDDYITVPSNSSLETLTDFTFSVWFKLSRVGDPYINIINKGPNKAEYGLYIYNPGYSESITLWLNGAGASAFSFPGGIALNTWYHVLYTRTGSAIKGYLNGAEIQTDTYGTQVVSGTDNLDIGYQEGLVGTYMFPGVMDDLRIYNRGVTAAEAKQLYNLGSGTVIRQ